MAGLWCTSLGYCNEELVETAYEQMRKLPFTHLFGGRSHDPAIELAEKLKEIAPVPISKVFFGASGSDANDTQVKLVWYMNNALGRPQKKKIISRLKGYHGVTVASASLTGLPNNHIDFDLPIAGILHTSCPHHYRFAEAGESEEDFATRLAAELEEMILREGPDTVAAFIAEPVMGAGGAVTPPEGYFEKINAVLAKYDVLLHRRRGHQRLRPHRQHVRHHDLWASTPTSISLRQGDHLGLFPAQRRDDERADLRGAASTRAARSAPSATATPMPAIRSAAPIAVKTLEIYQRDKIIEHVRRGGADLPEAPRRAGRSPAGRRGARRRPHRRHRAGQGQGDQGAVRGQEGRRGKVRRLRPGGRPDRARRSAAIASPSARR